MGKFDEYHVKPDCVNEYRNKKWVKNIIVSVQV